MTRIIPGPNHGGKRQAHQRRTRVIARVEREAALAAGERIASAERQAQAVLDRAQRDAHAHAAKARARAEREAATLIETARRDAVSRVKRAEATLTQLAVRIAEKLLHAQLTLQPSAIQAIVAACLEQLTIPAQTIYVRVNPLDVTALEQVQLELRTASDAAAELKLVTDDSVLRGGCIVDGSAQQIDASLQTQLAAIRAALQGLDLADRVAEERQLCSERPDE